MLFWVAMILFAFAFFSGARAGSTVHDCDAATGGVKHWQVLPPQWVCGPGHVHLTAARS